MNSINVAVVCLSHFQGGMELDAIRHTNMFERNLIQSILICRQGTFLESQAIKQNIPFISINFKHKLSIKLIYGIKKVIREKNLTHIVFFGASEIKSIFFAVKSSQCKVIIRHGTTKSTPKKDILHRLFYSCVSHYVAISNHLHTNILDILPAQSAQVTTIYPSLPRNETYLSDYKKTQDFLFVGRVEKGKGIFDAIIALGHSEIPTTCKKLTIVGSIDPLIKNHLYDLASNANITINLIGYVDDPSSYYESHRYFLFPSYGEGFGNVILEALYNNMICITYNNTVFPEFINLGFSNFYLAETRDIIDLSKKINIAFDMRNSSSKNNISLVNEFFSEKSAMKKWSDIFTWV
jgi:glycosyltransferase involved in cell wall biosynthesis